MTHPRTRRSAYSVQPRMQPRRQPASSETAVNVSLCKLPLASMFDLGSKETSISLDGSMLEYVVEATAASRWGDHLTAVSRVELHPGQAEIHQISPEAVKEHFLLHAHDARATVRTHGEYSFPAKRAKHQEPSDEYMSPQPERKRKSKPPGHRRL